MTAPIRLPADWEPHATCIMAWAVHREWGADVEDVRRELRNVVMAVAHHEPVLLLTPPDRIEDAERQAFGPDVSIVPAPVDDIWMRDIAPVFGWRGDEVVAVDLNFNGWGGTRHRRSRPGDRLAGLHDFGVPKVSASFIGEGGAFLTDGAGTAVTTRSCLLNPDRNPSGTEATIEAGLRAIGIANIVWLEGDRSEPVTSGHVDGYAMFTPSGGILVEAPGGTDPGDRRTSDIETLRSCRDASGSRLQVQTIRPPREEFWSSDAETFSPCYLNAHIANGGVVAPKFGDPSRDAAARKALAKAFPGREVTMLDIGHIAAGGGGIRCLTQPFPGPHIAGAGASSSSSSPSAS